MTQRRIVLTAALPYANGDLHIGHLVEYTMADMWARFQKMRGHECLYFCAEDTHGTPVMMTARKQGVTPEQFIAKSHAERLRDFGNFEVVFDHYSSTHSPENRKLVESFFKAMQDKGAIETRTIRQAYCEHDKMFLPDRFIVGTCPKCGAENQYGDSCEACSATYETLDLKNARCSICGTKPVAKDTPHLFFKLNTYRDFLKQWVPAHTAGEVTRKLDEWLKDELRDWDISREAPYFGFEIPGYPGKYFYVWVDAPIGYVATAKEWCDKNGRDLKEFWGEDAKSEVYHLIGKDIIYFHCLFWPAMLKTAGFKLPSSVWAHGMLTVNGVKMSKSKGTGVTAATYLKHLDPLYLRYYLACKMTPGIEDLDLNLDDFVARVNSDLIGKITNVASRGAALLHRLDGRMGNLDAEGQTLVRNAQKRGESIAAFFEARDFSKALLEIRAIADDANRYIDQYEPWKLIKEDAAKTKVVLTTALNLFRIMAIYLAPVLPSYTRKVQRLFNENDYRWQDAEKVLQDHALAPFEHLMQRIDPKKVEAMVEETKATAAKAAEQTNDAAAKASAPKSADAPGGGAATIEYDDFAKVDLRIARIAKAEHVEGADKLLRLTLDLGGETRNVFAGIKSAYQPSDLEGRLTVMVANLKPRKMKFGMSEGMVLAAGPGGKDIFLLQPDDGAKPGDKVN